MAVLLWQLVVTVCGMTRRQSVESQAVQGWRGAEVEWGAGPLLYMCEARGGGEQEVGDSLASRGVRLKIHWALKTQLYGASIAATLH